MSKTGKSVFCGTVAFVLFTMLRNYINVSNVIFFVSMCCVFILVSLSADYLQSRIKVTEKENLIADRVWAVIPVILLAVWMVLFYMNETNTDHSLEKEMLIRSYFPFPLWITITIVGTCICLWILSSKKIQNGIAKYSKIIRIVIALMFTVVTSIQFYAPNVFQDIRGGTYHSHAYTNCIINVCWLIPYSEDMQALYGHYAIIYMPFIKMMHSLFGVDYLTGIFIVSAVIVGISILLYLWVLNYFTKNDLIFYLGMLAIGEYYFMLMQGGVYLQVHPHRMIFPILLLAFALWEVKREKKHNVLAICVIALSIVWSTEVGLVMMVAFALYRWVQHSMDGKKLSIKKCWWLLRELMLFAFIPFVMAFLIVNGYNLLAGGPFIDLREFLYPLISDRGYIGQIELQLPDVTHAWIGTSVLFLIPVCMTAMSVLFQKKRDAEKQSFFFLIGIMSLGLLIYYVNRPVEGSLFIIMFFMLILQAVILQKAQDEYIEWKEDKESVFYKKTRFWWLSMRVITTLILFVMAFDCIYSMPAAWKISKETIWKRDELQEFADYIYVQVPPDAVSFGEGVPELLSMIDRDTHLHTTEWSINNLPLDTMERIRYELESEQWIFCNLYSLWQLQENYPGLTDDYELHEIFEYNGAQFGFFVRNE